MSKILVTGAAGFIGSTLSEKLLSEGYEVIGLDCFDEYYDLAQKRSNLQTLLKQKSFNFLEQDILKADLPKILGQVEGVFHLAARPGVRASWGRNFEVYLRQNVMATQALLEECKSRKLKKVVYASSSSVYGDCQQLPATEAGLPRPISPYGVSKLAAEHLVYLYWKNYGVPTVSLRYFTVYGPRQRPDMAFHRFLKNAHLGQPLQVFGTGEQSRDFTFVADAVQATFNALNAETVGRAYNIGGGHRASVKDVLKEVSALVRRSESREPKVEYLPDQAGDVGHTWADTSAAKKDLKFDPRTDLSAGLRAEFDWVREYYGSPLSRG